MTRSCIPSESLVPRIEAGEAFAIARLITRAEAGVAEARPALSAIYRKAGRAHVVGITGVPGSGKSTLVSKLVKRLTAEGAKVAIVAVDPTSPYSGGSILGDRVRMNDLALDPGVFIRSMATHGAVGGMAHATLDVVDILDVAGFDFIIVETVGVGQDEVEIAQASHTTVVVSAPGLGDEIQAIKAGLLEIADVHVVSKCDRSDSNRTITDLKLMLKDQQPRENGWHPPVIGLSSFSGEGFPALMDALNRHRAALAGIAGEVQRKRIAAFRLKKTAEALALEQFRRLFAERGAALVQHIASRQDDPYSAASKIVRELREKQDV